MAGVPLVRRPHDYDHLARLQYSQTHRARVSHQGRPAHRAEQRGGAFVPVTLVTESVPETLWIPYDTLAKGNIEEPFRPATQRLCRNPLSAGGDLGTRVEKRRPVAIALERRRLPAGSFPQPASRIDVCPGGPPAGAGLWESSRNRLVWSAQAMLAQRQHGCRTPQWGR